MKSLTIFSAPKPFTDPHINLIQRNALQSWIRVGEDVQVILIGDEVGVDRVAEEYGVLHVPDAACNEWNTPLVSSIFDLARRESRHELMVYVNGDIILTPELLRIAREIDQQREEFLAVGRRWDLDVVEPISFHPGWPGTWTEIARREGQLRRSVAIDYFLFRRGQFQEMPHFAIGRAGWDNWMIYHARAMGWEVIDLTPSLVVIHQNHDYGHLPDGKKHYDLEETDINRDLAGGPAYIYNLLDANREYRGGKIRKVPFSWQRFFRNIERVLRHRKPTPLQKVLRRRFRKLWVRLEKG